MKSYDQIEGRIPSGLIPLHEGMLISFVNYELKVKFEGRTQHEINSLSNKAQEYFKDRKPGSLGYQGEVIMEELNKVSQPPSKAADPPKKEDKPVKKVQIEDPPKETTPGEIVENPPMSGGKKKTIPPKTIPADMVKPDDSKNAELRKKFLTAKKVMLPEKTEA